MPERPLLVFPHPSSVSKAGRAGGAQTFAQPSKDRQVQRIRPQLSALEQAFEAKRVFLSQTIAGAIVEMVLVIETVGSINEFLNAVRRIPEMEWLVEWEEEAIEPDEDFYVEDNLEKLLPGRLYLIMTNQQALSQLRSLWDRYENDLEFGHGLKKWARLFEQIKTIRSWGVEDRLRETGALEDWRQRVESNEETVRFEIELWFRATSQQREQSAQVVANLLQIDNGSIVNEAIIEEIGYHALLAEAPIAIIQDVLQQSNVRFLQSDPVMFFRPLGQTIVDVPQDLVLVENLSDRAGQLPTGEPIVALLDGLPLTNHILLDNRLTVDDPDSFETGYLANERNHGTAMASLVVHGDLSDGNGPPLTRPIYCRSILKPDPSDTSQPRREIVPVDVLPLDLINRSVKRMFEGEMGAPSAPTIKVINLSVGDTSRPFISQISPWAKLLDWLSYKYRVLFIVSAGNCTDEIILSVERSGLSALTPEQLRSQVLLSILSNLRHRRILSPAESINSLTVGASHSDLSLVGAVNGRIDVFNGVALASPISRNGNGFHRSVKPDILISGGRQLCRAKMGNTHSNATLVIPNNTGASVPPGQKVAAPNVSGTRYVCGTSNSAALLTRLSAILYEEVFDLLAQNDLVNGTSLDISVLLRSLLVHASSWGGASSFYESELQAMLSDNDKIKDTISSILGYGEIDGRRVMECTSHRATLIGFGQLPKDSAHSFSFPLPVGVSGQSIWKRLVVTLSWFSPINPKNQKYRVAHLWFDAPLIPFVLKRKETFWRTAQRGTLQHEIFEGTDPGFFGDGATATIKVSCREDGGNLNEDVLYALAVTFEVDEALNVDIYEQIRTRLQTPISVS